MIAVKGKPLLVLLLVLLHPAAAKLLLLGTSSEERRERNPQLRVALQTCAFGIWPVKLLFGITPAPREQEVVLPLYLEPSCMALR